MYIIARDLHCNISKDFWWFCYFKKGFLLNTETTACYCTKRHKINPECYLKIHYIEHIKSMCLHTLKIHIILKTKQFFNYSKYSWKLNPFWNWNSLKRHKIFRQALYKKRYMYFRELKYIEFGRALIREGQFLCTSLIDNK